MLNLWLYSLLGAVIAILAALANSSLRRLHILANLASLIIFFAFPFSEAIGFLSRQTIHPTLAALSPLKPLFWLIPLGLSLSLLGLRFIKTKKVHALLSLLTGTLNLCLIIWWFQGQTILSTLQPLNGLMEIVTGLILALVIILIGWSYPKQRWFIGLLALAMGLAVFFALNSPRGHGLFPNSQGYYKVFKEAPSGSEAEIIASYNAGLDSLNRQRRTIGLGGLEPITNLKALDGQKLPREAAEAGFRLIDPQSRGYGVWLFFLLQGLLIGLGLMLFWKPQLSAHGDMSSGSVFALVICALTPAFAATEFSFRRLVEGWPFLLSFLDRSWPPLLADAAFERFPLQEVASQMLLTLEIALVGTFLAAIFALPLSFLAARNLSQNNRLMRFIFAITRGFFNVDRGIDTLILALIFVAAVGLGPFAGVLAMAIHSIADLGKLYSESIENVDKGPIEALESVGASASNVVRWAIVPQVLPLFVSWTLYRFEINFRVSIVLGLVGAGGIGFFIQEKMASGQYNQMVIAIIAIILVVNIIDFASSWLRSKLI
ncbi:MAG: phosphonate ABC transporter, permease protein PhnE [Deinococcales bacterium]